MITTPKTYQVVNSRGFKNVSLFYSLLPDVACSYLVECCLSDFKTKTPMGLFIECCKSKKYNLN